MGRATKKDSSNAGSSTVARSTRSRHGHLGLKAGPAPEHSNTIVYIKPKYPRADDDVLSLSFFVSRFFSAVKARQAGRGQLEN